MYAVRLYCSDSACDAVFEAEGALEAIEAAICPFCGCCLAELTCIPCGEPADEGEAAFPELELWIVQEPAGRRLRRRRRSKKRLPKAA